VSHSVTLTKVVVLRTDYFDHTKMAPSSEADTMVLWSGETATACRGVRDVGMGTRYRCGHKVCGARRGHDVGGHSGGGA
jgi:hypothetical protein